MLDRQVTQLIKPAIDRVAAALLAFGFKANQVTLAGFGLGVLAAKRGLANTAYPNKSFYFLGGLTEATETLAFFVAMCLWPQHFAALAYSFAGLCAVTIVTRIWWGYRAFAD